MSTATLSTPTPTVLEAQPRPEVKVFDNTGVDVKTKIPISTQIYSAYGKLTASPLNNFCFYSMLAIFVGHLAGVDLWDYLTTICSSHSSDKNRFIASTFNILSRILKFTAPFKLTLMLSYFVVMPYLVKNSAKNFKFMIFFQILVLLFANDENAVFIFCLSQLWFLFAEVSSPQLKTFLVITAVVVAFIFVPSLETPPSPSVKMADQPQDGVRFAMNELGDQPPSQAFKPATERVYSSLPPSKSPPVKNPPSKP